MFRKSISIVGEILITLGVLALLYLAYTLWFTNTVAEFQTASSAQRLLKSFETTTPPNSEPDLAEEEPLAAEVNPFVPVEPFGLVYIPRLKSDVWEEPLVKGIYNRALASGIGYYPSTEMPGETGNFAIAGHRATNGEPFARFERLETGDAVFVRTEAGWFEYQLVKDRIVQPDEVWVLGDSPAGEGFDSGAKLITLTTCDPRFNSYQRWIWWGELVATYPQDQTPDQILEVG